MHIDEYERKQHLYQAFAQTVAVVLTAAIEHSGGYRLQVVRARAKNPDSLRKKLVDQNLADSGQVDHEIKDLAGCRAIFYTNGDVEKLIGSGLVDENFEVLARRVHNPGIHPKTANQMYTANHYLVTLRPDRLALPEYARFAGMRCEIQLQTILNHAWAELEHDIIYKAPAPTPNFGAEALESIKQRLQGIATKYLVPAGYEFDKATVDFERLVQGKTLLDRDALAAIAQAADNNVRYEAIQTFGEHVLSLYDDPQSIMVDVVHVLLEAAEKATDAATVPIDTPFGGMAGKTFEDIAELIGRILRPYRYVDVSRTLAVARHLHRLAKTPSGRTHAIELAQSVAKHDLKVWRAYGPVMQRLVIDEVAALDTENVQQDLPLLAATLESVLDLEVTGATFSSNAVALDRATVPGSGEIAAIRSDALRQLERLFASAQSDSDRNRIISAMSHAAQPPYGAAPTRELSEILIANAVAVIDFFTKIVGTLGLEQAQVLERRVHRYFKRYRAVRTELADDPEMVRLTGQIAVSTARFRAVLASVSDLDEYKVLVGFDSIFPGSWEDRDLDHEEAERYRAEQADALLAQIDAQNFPEWLDRLERFAQTESTDLATFMQFAPFLARLAAKLPEQTLARLDSIGGKLDRFLFKLLAGLLQSPLAAEARQRITLWLERGEKLGQVSWLLLAANDLPEELFRAVLASGVAHDDREVLKNVVRACTHHFSGDRAQPSFHQAVLLEATAYLVEHRDHSWIAMGSWFSWYGSKVLQSLDDRAAGQVLDWLVPLPDLETQVDYLIASVAKDRPLLALNLLDRRITLARTEQAPGFVAIPYDLNETTQVLQKIPESVLEASRRWFDAEDQSLEYSVERLLEAVFDDFSPVLRTSLEALLASGQRNDALFALEILGATKDQDAVFDLVRKAVAQWADEDVLERVDRAIAHEGMTEGEFGRIKALEAKKRRLDAWRSDPSERVQGFAKEAIHNLDQRIASETRRTQAMLASRRMQYGENPVNPTTGDEPANPESTY